MKKRIFACLVSLILMLSSIPLNASATDEPNLVYLDISKGTITISAGTILAYSPDGTRVRNFDSTATYVVTGTSNNTNIIVNGGAVTLMFDNCNIDLSNIDDACAVILKNNSNLSIGVISDSTIKSGKKRAGIQVTANATVNFIKPITGTGGTLNVYGGDEASAIGSNMNTHSGTINVNYGIVNLYGGSNSSALGRSNGYSTNKSVSISGSNTIVNVYGKSTAIDTQSLSICDDAILNCQSSADNHAIVSDKTTVTDATVNASTPGKGTALFCGTITLKDSKINAESYGGTAIGKTKSSSNKTYITVTNSTLTVKSPASAYAIDGYSVSITDSEVFVLDGILRGIPKNAFVYIDKVCTYTPSKPLTVDYTVPDGHTLIVPENTVVEIGEGGKLRQGNGTLIIEGTLYYPGTMDGTENGDPVLDNFALFEDEAITWHSDISHAFRKIETSTADNIELKLFASAEFFENLPQKDLTIDVNGYDMTTSTDTYDELHIENKQHLKIINSSQKTSDLNFCCFHNYGTATIDGNINVNFEITNNGGTVNLINTDMSSVCSVPFDNCDGGIINLDGAYLYGDSGGGYNDEGCTLNITNGGRIVSDLSGITNYGTINADDFTIYSYGRSIINNGGKVTLKNGNFIAYGPSISNTDGYVYAENCTMNSYETGNGIKSTGTLFLKDSTISSSEFGFAGVSHSGTLTIENCTISGCYNGVYFYEGTAKISNSSLYGGFESYNGYGLYNGGEMTVENCDIYGGYGVGNSGTIHLKDTDINNLQNYYDESYAIFNSGDFHFENGIINGSISAYIDEGGTAEIKKATIKGFDFSWDYDPTDLYGNEATFNMTNGTVKLFDCTLPNGFYVVTDQDSEEKYVIKDLIAEKYMLCSADDNSAVVLDNETAMLDGAYCIKPDESFLPDFGAGIADINAENVTSDDLEAINAELSLANEYNIEDYSEKIAAKISQTKEKCNALLEIINSVKKKYESITDSINKINADELTTDATIEIEAIITEANILLGTNNLTADERTKIETAKAQLEGIVSDLVERKSAIDSAVEKAEEIASGKPTTDDEEKVNKLIAEIDELLLLEITEEEREKLNSAKAQLEGIASDLVERKSAIDSAVEKAEEIASGKPTTDDEEKVNKLIAEIDELLLLEITEAEQSALESAKKSALSVLVIFEKSRNKLAELKAEYESIDYKKVNIFDKNYLEDLSERISQLIDEGILGTNETDEANALESEVNNLIELVQTPMFYGFIRIFWTIISMIKTIFL